MRRDLILVAFSLLAIRHALFSQDGSLVPTGVPVLSGYAKEIAGESIDYHSFHPFAKQALLTRTTDGRMAIEWKTEPIPEEYDTQFAYFVWIAGHNAGTSGGDRSFDFFVNGERWFTFHTSHSKPQRYWRLSGPDGSSLTFQRKWSDQLDDMYGYMCLKVPVARVGKGEPARLKVVGENAQSRDWYMTFKYVFAESLIVKSQPALIRCETDTCQLVDVFVDHAAVGGSVSISTEGSKPVTSPLELGWNALEFPVRAVKIPTSTALAIRIDGAPPRNVAVVLNPVVPRAFYFLPHSHNDIGYSDIQPDVEKKQHKNLRDAVDLAKKTANYPPEARFRWNTEILWPVESYLQQASDNDRREFIDAVKEGSIGVPALFANQLTGICKPEELFRLTDCARRLSKQYGITINSATISDVPGYTWSIVPALAQCGIKYFSSGPNYVPSIPDGGDRIGSSSKAWGDHPFYWKSPSGQEKILFWMAGRGYSWFHGWMIGKVGPTTKEHLFDYLAQLDSAGYPYDMVQVRYTVYSDNGPVDPDLPDFVKNWNEKYISPKIVIATTSQMFEEFERRYADKLPTYGGDLTPYWEDGALSTARELSMTKQATERLLQSEVLYSIISPVNYNPEKFYQVWRNVHLFDEHTWGAWNSITEPDSPFAVTQWRIKQQYALDADRQSRELMQSILGNNIATPTAFDVINTNSWPRTDLVVLPRKQVPTGEVVVDETGKSVPSQRLSSGDLAFLARDVPPLAAKRYTIRKGRPKFQGSVHISVGTMENQFLKITLNPQTGSIASATPKSFGQELIDTSVNAGMNEFLYVAGLDPASAEKNSVPTISVKERGPLVVSLLITSDAPGCNSLVREVRLVDGIDQLEIINTIDKKKVREKEAVHIAFPFHVPGGQIRIDDGWGIVRPDSDQLEGSCRDYISAQRWVDVSGTRFGVTWSTDYSALVEVGTMTSEVQSNDGYRAWRTSVGPSTTFYSYVMNNYWHTNYKADQEGPVTIRYAVRPHGTFDPAACYRFGVETNQPLIVREVGKGIPKLQPLLALTSPAIVVTSMKPSEDGKALMVRLFNTSGQPQHSQLRWRSAGRGVLFQSSPSEERREELRGSVDLQPFDITTLRYEFAK